MEELSNKIQAVINTLNSVTVNGFDNMDKMVGCMKVLADVRDVINQIPEQKEDADGNADAE
jgi:hypothetical protein